MRWLSRWRWLLARRPWIRWLLVAAAAGLAALAVTTEVDALHRARARWGTTVDVLVATRALDPGDALAGTVERRGYPVALVPNTAVRTLAPDAVAVQRIGAGEVVVEADLAVAAGPLALLPAGWLAVAVPIADAGPDAESATWMRTGDAAVVLADGQTLAEHAVVLSRTDTEVVVGVPAADTAAVADAANRRVAVIAVSASPQR